MFDTGEGEGTDRGVPLVSGSWEEWEAAFGRAIPSDLGPWVPAGVPSWLDDLPGGPVLAEALETLDMERLSAADRVVVLRARRRLIAHHEGAFHEDVTAVSAGYEDPDPAFTHDGTAAEIRAALRLTRRAADSLVDRAHDLSHRLPTLLAALRSGSIDMARVRVIVDRTRHLPAPHARMVCDEVQPRAMWSTTGQLRARVDRLCLEIDPDGARRRREDAVGERSVTSELTEDGTITLTGWNLPPDRAARAAAHIDAIARSLRVDGETRTMDQLRADVYLDLLCGTPSVRDRTSLHVTVDLDTLTALAEHPGELAGYGPITADIARQLADTATNVDWTVTDPGSGQPLSTGTTRRRPSSAQHREVVSRDRTCVFPGCRMAATSCDLDHITPWSVSGRTTTHDLAPTCRHDHVRRHRHRWTYERTADGDYIWTSPLGHRSTTSGRPP